METIVDSLEGIGQETIELGDINTDFFIELKFEPGENGLNAFTHFEAEGRGKEALNIVRSLIQTHADSLGSTVTHIVEAVNPRSRKFFSHQQDYTYRGIHSERGCWVFIRIYEPQEEFEG